MVDGAERNLTEAQKAWSAEKDYAEMIRGFITSAFSEILDELAVEANEVLAGVENTQDITIRFDLDKISADGDLAARIIPVVSIRGHEIAPGDLSGGQATMLDLAVDLLAIGKVAARRTGFEPGWLILDEAFDGLGSADKEGCLSILAQHAQAKLIFVVTHNIEFKEVFARRIRVSMGADGASVIEE